MWSFNECENAAEQISQELKKATNPALVALKKNKYFLYPEKNQTNTFNEFINGIRQQKIKINDLGYSQVEALETFIARQLPIDNAVALLCNFTDRLRLINFVLDVINQVAAPTFGLMAEGEINGNVYRDNDRIFLDLTLKNIILLDPDDENDVMQASEINGEVLTQFEFTEQGVKLRALTCKEASEPFLKLLCYTDGRELLIDLYEAPAPISRNEQNNTPVFCLPFFSGKQKNAQQEREEYRSQIATRYQR